MVALLVLLLLTTAQAVAVVLERLELPELQRQAVMAELALHPR
jgi:hypothetical protein